MREISVREYFEKKLKPENIEEVVIGTANIIKNKKNYIKDKIKGRLIYLK